MALIDRFALCARWPAKSSVHKLIGRIKTFAAKVLGPGGQRLPMALGIVGVALGLGDCGSEDQHVAAFLDRHVLGIGLAVGQRIGAHVVRGERFFPAAAFGEVERSARSCL